MAVTYYNQTVLGGTSYPRYPDPLVTGAPNADGLYPWSTFRARFAIISGLTGAVDATTTFNASGSGGNINLLLFTSDVPALGYIAPAATGLSVGPVAPTSFVGPSSGITAFFEATAGGTNVIVAAGQVGVGYVSTGASTDADRYVYVAGFPAVYTATGTVADAELWLWANSPNICSPVSFQNWDSVDVTTAATSGALPIVLYYGDYTQAIRDAGNIIVNKVAPIGATYQVVGLWSQGGSKG